MTGYEFTDSEQLMADLIDAPNYHRQFREMHGLEGEARPRYWDREGKPITLGVWAVLIERGAWYGQVAHTRLQQGVEISTVWVGLDLWAVEHDSDAPPLIFETMVFDGEMAGDTCRWATETDAIAGHLGMVEIVKLDLASRE